MGSRALLVMAPLLSVRGEKCQAFVLAESNTRRTHPDCFSYTAYQADVHWIRLIRFLLTDART